jgi:hypothetical protein
VTRDEGPAGWDDGYGSGKIGRPRSHVDSKLPRLLEWTVVQEDTAVFDIHVLWDTPDLDAATDAAFLHGQAFFGPNLPATACSPRSTTPTTASASGDGQGLH